MSVESREWVPSRVGAGRGWERPRRRVALAFGRRAVALRDGAVEDDEPTRRWAATRRAPRRASARSGWLGSPHVDERTDRPRQHRPPQRQERDQHQQRHAHATAVSTRGRSDLVGSRLASSTRDFASSACATGGQQPPPRGRTARLSRPWPVSPTRTERSDRPTRCRCAASTCRWRWRCRHRPPVEDLVLDGVSGLVEDCGHLRRPPRRRHPSRPRGAPRTRLPFFTICISPQSANVASQ